MKAIPSKPEWQAVIDIGSNSVRLVIYDVAGRALLPHYNEKVMARLGASLSRNGKLSRDGKKVAMKAIQRYDAILNGLNVTKLRAVGTAAVRRASDGQDFVAQIEKQTGIRVDIIDGAEEARLSALGVDGSVYQASGTVGDLGGSSLEFAHLSKGKVKSVETHMLGPLALSPEGLDVEALRQRVRKSLSNSKALKKKGGRFYMVGGAWRALAKLHMDLSSYPLRQLHAYVMDRKALDEIAAIAEVDNAINRQRLEKISVKRSSVLPYASILLGEIFRIGEFHDVMLSSHGLREGLVLDSLQKSASKDPLLDGVALSARLYEQRRDFGRALMKWVRQTVDPSTDLFGNVGVDHRLIGAACLLADSGARFHPDTRAQLAFDQSLTAPSTGVTHPERVFIALAIGNRYSRRFRAPEKVMGLLSAEQSRLAKQLGAAMRLGAVFSGRSSELLQVGRLHRGEKMVSLIVSEKHKSMVSSMVERRLETLAEVLELKASIEIS